VTTPPSPEFFALQQAVAGRYSLEREIGRGGMGVVFLARDVALDRPVAIKLLPPALAAQPAARARFLREARTAARLSHPHIVPIHAVEETDDLAFYVMSFVDGETLGTRVRRAGPLAAAEALRVTQEIAWALAHAHAHGVVHRDVKPDNVLLERGTGRALVTDFGIARPPDGGTPADGTPAATPLGTPAYMSPEQAAGERADARSDLYSLGVTAYFAASGRLPFDAPTALAMMARHAAEPAPALLAARPSLPPVFARAVDRCLAKDPAARWADAESFARALDPARGALPEIPRPVRDFLVDADSAGGQLAIAVCAGLVAVAWMPIQNDFFGIMRAAMMFAAALVLALAGLRVGLLAQRARSLLRLGYGHDAVRAGLVSEERQRADEVEAAGGRTVLVVAVCAAVTALADWAVSRDMSSILTVLAIAAMIVAPAAGLLRLWTSLRAGRASVWHHALAGGVGRGLFRLAGVGLPDAPPSPVAGEPTVVALGRAAEELFDALPAGDRARLGDVRALLGRLRADALAMRARGDDPATAVAAMEAVRLDLLRLHAGGGSMGELTRDVDAARELGERIDAELAARDEVRRLLEEREATPV
jgi:serine/threonine-protein kinase